MSLTFAVGALLAAGALATTASAGSVTLIVPAGQADGVGRPVLTGAGQYSYLAPTFDRAAKNNYPNRAGLLGELYLGDGGATATYTLASLAAKPTQFAVWINYSEDGLHAAGDRSVAISIPQAGWSIVWSNPNRDTKGWKAEQVGTVTVSGPFTVSFRKQATTAAAFVMNAFALTTATQMPAFGTVPAAPGAPAPATGSGAAQPIVGTWQLADGGQMKVTATGPTTFAGAIAKASPGDCPLPIGFKRWAITGSGTSYTGTLAWFNNCKRASADGKATWKLSTVAGQQTRMAFCITKPGPPLDTGPWTPFCSQLSRVEAVDREAPSVTAFAAVGRGGSTIKLHYDVVDNGGQTHEKITVLRGTTQLFAGEAKLHAVQREHRFSGGFLYSWASGTTRGALRYCVQAWDPAGNASKVACAALNVA